MAHQHLWRSSKGCTGSCLPCQSHRCIKREAGLTLSMKYHMLENGSMHLLGKCGC